MRPLSVERWNTPWILLGGVCALLALAAVILPDILGTSRPGELLQHLDGSLDHRHYTLDPVKSDLYVRASHALKEGDTRSAETIYKEVIAKHPKDSDGYAALGACLFFQERYEEARAEYLLAMALNSKSESAFYGLGCIAYKQSRNIEAKDYLEKALALNQNDGCSHRVLGLVYEQLGDVPDALVHYERAMALDPVVAGDGVVRARLKALKP